MNWGSRKRRHELQCFLVMELPYRAKYTEMLDTNCMKMHVSSKTPVTTPE